MTSAESDQNKGSDEMLQKDGENNDEERDASDKGGFLSRLV